MLLRLANSTFEKNTLRYTLKVDAFQKLNICFFSGTTLIFTSRYGGERISRYSFRPTYWEVYAAKFYALHKV